MKTISAKQRCAHVVAGFVVLLFLGIAYAWSIFVGPLESAYGWTRTQTSLAFTILMIGFSAGSFLTGILAGKFGYRKISVAAALLVGAGFSATAFTSDIGVLYVTYGVLAGVGIGMLYNTSISVIPLWFPEKKGMITGVLLMGYALSTSVLSPVCQRLLESMGPRATFLILGILDLAVFLIGSFFMEGPGQEAADRPAEQEETGTDCTPGEMLRTGRFYIYFFAANFLVMAALGYLNHAAPAMQGELGMSAVNAAYVVSAMSLCNGIARPIAGQFVDRMGVRPTVRILSLLYTAASVLAVAALAQGSTVLMVIASCMLLFGYGCQGSSMPSVIRKLYGNRYFSINYSIISIVSLTASFCPSIVGVLQSATGSYLAGFAMMAVCCAASVPLMFAVGPKKK